MSENNAKSQNPQPKRPFWKMKRFLIPAILFTFFVVVGSSGSGSSTSNANVSQNSTSSASQSTQTTALQDQYKVGDTVKVDNYTFTINKVEDNVASGNQFIVPKAGNKFMKINLTIENNGKDKTAVSTMLQMYLKDSEGTKFNQTFLPDQKQIDGELLANDKIKGDIVYEVPASSTGLKFYYNAAWLTGKSIVVEL